MAKKLYLFLGSVFTLGGFEILISKIMSETHTLAVSSTLFVLASLAAVLFFSENEKEKMQAEKLLLCISENAKSMAEKIESVSVENSNAEIKNLIARYKDNIDVLNTVSDNINILVNENPKLLAECIDILKAIQAETNSCLEDNFKNATAVLKDIQEKTDFRIEENFVTVAKILKDNIRKVINDIYEYNTNISDEIKKLAGEYDEFKKHSSALVENMTQTNKNDLDALRKILNG